MDHTLLPFINQTLAHPVLDVLMVAVTLIGNPTYYTFAIVALCVIIKPWRKMGVGIGLTLLVTFGFTMLFQFTVLRPRPDPDVIRLIWPQPNFPSYPSGHSACAFAVAAFFGLRFRSPRVWAMGLAWAMLVALSRVYLGHHYPSDVIGGAILGAGVGATMSGLLHEPMPGIQKARWLLCFQIALALFVTHMAYLNLIPWRYLRWPYADKVFHVLLFGAITLWLNLWLRGRAMHVGRWSLPVAIALPFTVALIEECLQSLSPYRTFDLFDLSCDLLGMGLAWWLSTTWMSRTYSQTQ
jgi:undecaprenyl-diphosphatase